VFFRAFMAWKAMIPVWAPFRWDPQLAAVDAWLHGGDPWRYIPTASLPFLDAVYYAWFPLLAVMVLWQAWQGEIRFFFAFALAWIVLGTGVALLVSSAGPVFYQGVTGDPRFAGLDLDPSLTARRVADALWAAYRAGEPTSISAFPSLHVAVPALYCAVLWGTRLRWPAVGFLLFTSVGSVALGWHYAVDAYAGVIGAVVCWMLAGWLSRGFIAGHPEPSVADPARVVPLAIDVRA
jgi:hypothetical protein